MRRAEFMEQYLTDFLTCLSLGLTFRRQGHNVVWIYPWRQAAFEASFLRLTDQQYFLTLRNLDAIWPEKCQCREDDANFT